MTATSFSDSTSSSINVYKKLLSKNIFDIIQKSDPDKTNSHKMISIWIIRICRRSICRTLKAILNECMSNSVFQSK